jgi:hypothetical protein
MTQELNSKGFTLVVVIIVVSILAALGSAIITLTTNQLSSGKNFQRFQRAESLAEIGLQRTIQSFDKDEDWSNDSGYNNVSYIGGRYTASLSNASTHNVTITSVGSYNGVQIKIVKDIDRVVNEEDEITDAFYHHIDISNTYLSGKHNEKLNLIMLTNSNPTRDIILEEMIVLWIDDDGEELKKVKIGGGPDKWHGHASSGEMLDINDTLLPNQSTPLPPHLSAGFQLILEFKDSMLGKKISIYFRFTDGSTSCVDFDPVLGEEMAGSLFFNLENAEIKGKDDNDLEKIFLMNVSTSNVVVLDKIEFSWFYNNPIRELDKVKIDRKDVWKEGGASSGDLLDIDDFDLSPGDSKELNVKFDDDINYRKISFTCICSDGSTKSATVDFTINQAEHLSFINDGVQLIDNDETLDQLSLRNNHAEADIWIEKMKISLEPNLSQEVQTVFIDGVSVFSGIAALDVTFNITSKNISANDTVLHKIEFDSEVTDTSLSITYYFIDGTEKLNRYDLIQPPGNALFQASTNNTKIVNKENPADLEGIFLSNPNAYNYTITHIRPSWTPVGTRLIEEIEIGGTRVWSGPNASSGVLLELDTPYTIQAGQTDIENILLFNEESINVDFDIEYTFDDVISSTASIQVQLNPASWFAGENFETDSFSGGYGFDGDWVVAGKVDTKKSNETYSGVYSLEVDHEKKVAGGSYAKRKIDLSGLSNMNIRFFARTKGIKHGDFMYFEISEASGGPWQTVDTWGKGAIDNYTYCEYDLSSYNLNSDFWIRFRCNSSKKIESFI